MKTIFHQVSGYNSPRQPVLPQCAGLFPKNIKHFPDNDSLLAKNLKRLINSIREQKSLLLSGRKCNKFFIILISFLFYAFSQPAYAELLHGADNTVIAQGIKISVKKQATYLTIIFSKKVQATYYALEHPNRLIIDLPGVEFHVTDNNLKRNGGLVASFRYGLIAENQSRIVIDLKSPVSVQKLHGQVEEAEGSYYIAFELKAASTSQFRELVNKTEPYSPNQPDISSEIPSQTTMPADERKPVIVIDPGHGGIDPGAVTQTGIQEKDIVFAFAATVVKYLEAQNRFHVIMTRQSDIFVPLNERVRIAQKARADLFISIHADSISAAPQVSGFTVYTVSDKASDRESALLAAKENQADSIAGIETSDLKDQVVDILQELTIRETRLMSKRFARLLIEHFGNVMRLNKNPSRQAGFHVLKAYDIPSILIELGYLSSGQDISLLTSEEWRNNAAQAITESINSFFPPASSQNKP